LASAEQIPPGGEGKIDVTFKVGSRAGKQQKSISVATNDPEHKNIQLTVSADVKVVLNLEPSRVNFGSIQKKAKAAPQYLSLTGSDAGKVKITSIKSENSFLKIETSNKGFDGDQSKKIKVTVQPGMKVGKFREQITVYTDHEALKELSFYVFGEVMGNIEVKPRYLSFGTIEQGKPIEGKVSVKALGDAKFKVVGVQSPIPELTTKVETVKKGKEYIVHVRVQEDFSGDVLKGNLTIQTDDKEEDKIDVRVYGRRKAPPKAGLQTTVAPQQTPPAPAQNK